MDTTSKTRSPPCISPATPSACPRLDHPPEERIARFAGLAVSTTTEGSWTTIQNSYLRPRAGGSRCLMPRSDLGPLPRSDGRIRTWQPSCSINT